MKKLFVLIISLVVSVLNAEAQFRDGRSYQNLYDSETVTAMRGHVGEISAASMDGRKAGSEGETAAAAYVRAKLEEYGVDLLCLKEGDVFGLRTESGDTLTSRNVIGYVQGYDKDLSDHYIVVGARLDNLGSVPMTVDGRTVDRIYYGANGNASGLAMLVELARMVNTNSIMFRRSVLFAAFGASAETFAGAWYFLNRSFPEKAKIDAMVNLDMLGTGYHGFYLYTGSNADMNALAASLAGELQPVHPELVSGEIYPSDYRAFYAKDIPFAHFTTGHFPEHNTEKDTQSIIDYEMMERELEYVYNYVQALANMDQAPSFIPVQKTERGPSYDDVVAYYDCDQRPMFLNSPDPAQFMEKWVYQYLKYPESAIVKGIQGRVTVEFIIEKDGKVTNVRVVKGVSDELDAEAVKVISASPKWRPGRVKGNKVRTSIAIPVEFKLEKKTSKGSFGIRK